ncbi:MAG TPA: aminotransferase class IV [Candidatus Acidoferrales bacterium]|nr:aminotransferase class IV [Candidatus Acidoferrales bacterium]
MNEIKYSDPRREISGSENFYVFYSTFLGGFTRDRFLMSVPIDDHIVHRGDGVFDNALCIDGNYYLLNQHIERFFFSAKSIGIQPPFTQEELKGLSIELGILSGKKNFIARFFLSRGHGSMSVYPHEAISPNLYILLDKWSAPPERYYKTGMVAVTSPTGMHSPISPQVKSVDYLSNALMELAARNSGADSAIAVDGFGNITEGSNKNVVVIGKDGVLRVPPQEKILRGTSLVRALEFAPDLQKKKTISRVSIENIPLTEAYNASEILFLSTSLFVAPVIKYDGRTVGDGKPGRVWRSLYELFQKDIRSNRKYLTPLKHN